MGSVGFPCPPSLCFGYMLHLRAKWYIHQIYAATYRHFCFDSYRPGFGGVGDNGETRERPHGHQRRKDIGGSCLGVGDGGAICTPRAKSQERQNNECLSLARRRNDAIYMSTDAPAPNAGQIASWSWSLSRCACSLIVCVVCFCVCVRRPSKVRAHVATLSHSAFAFYMYNT